MQLATRFDWRYLRNTVLTAATRLYQRAFPEAPSVAELRRSAAGEAQAATRSAADHMRDAFQAIRGADASATEAQLFTELRLMVNNLEHGGLRSEAPTPEPSPIENTYGRTTRVQRAIRELGAMMARH